MAADESHDDKTQSFIALTSGTSVLHYKILEKIGSGGMGEVYLALDTNLNRKVALKFLPTHLCQDEDCRKRFKREAQAAAKLSHPNIIHVYEVSEYQGRPFFAMEHVEGRSLRDVKAEALDVDRIVGIAIQLCDGLHTAHTAGVTHRDIKPSNIIIDSSGRPRLLDFGLATVKGGEHLTRTGSTLGTVGYMSPEQIEGKATDARSDLFSLGVVLYELIANKSPFRRDDETATLKAILQDTPEPLARYKSGVPDDLQRIVSKLLEKDPTLRYQSATGVIPDLKKLSAMSTMNVGIERRPDRWNRYVVLSAVVILIAVVTAWYFGDHKGEPSGSGDKIRMVVLPFENLGDPKDEYFADGITDEITSRLAKLSALGVISRSSAVHYKKTDKTPQQIAEELDVEFILEGTIRWDKSGAISRVRITPQLIEVANNTHLWADNYERDISDIFDIQVEIASNIVTALDIALVQQERDALNSRPTDNVDAYQAYMKGLSYLWEADYTEENMLASQKLLERAVELDPRFVEALAALADAHANIYHFGFDRTVNRLEEARKSIAKALSINPNHPDVLLADGTYYYVQGDYHHALDRFIAALDESPEDDRILKSIAAVYRRQGRLEEAIRHFKKAVEVSPRSAFGFTELGFTYQMSQRYDEADSCFDRLIALAPEQIMGYDNKACLYQIWKGDLATARKVLERAPEREALHISVFRTWWWQAILEQDYGAALQRVNSLQVDFIEGQLNRHPTALYAAQCYWLMGDTVTAHLLFDSARVLLEPIVRQDPEDFRSHSALGIAYAGLGRVKEAIREANFVESLMPVSKDAIIGAFMLVEQAYTYILAREYERAIDAFEHIVSLPQTAWMGRFRLDPRLDPLRENPRFQKLIEKYEREHGI